VIRRWWRGLSLPVRSLSVCAPTWAVVAVVIHQAMDGQAWYLLLSAGAAGGVLTGEMVQHWVSRHEGFPCRCGAEDWPR